MKIRILIQEIKLDKTTDDLTKNIFSFIKTTKEKFDRNNKNKSSNSFSVIIYEPIFFEVKITVKRNPNLENSKLYFKDLEKGFSISAASIPSEDDFVLEIELDPIKEPGSYFALAGWIKDHLRHEMEHITQSQFFGINSFKIANGYKYLISSSELSAMVKGMYAKAKHEKKYLDDVFNEYLDYVEKKGDLKNKNERKIVFDKWIEFTKRNLPNAKLRQ